VETLWNDIRHAARLLHKTPAVSIVAILALSVGIGLTTAMFSIVYGAMLRGLPSPIPIASCTFATSICRD
jgi:hypothetical protein